MVGQVALHPGEHAADGPTVQLDGLFQLLRAVGCLKRRYHVDQLASHQHVVVAGVEPDAVVGDAVLRAVVGADLLLVARSPEPICASLLAPSSACCSASIFSYRRARSTLMAAILFWSCDFWSCDCTTSPVGRCVMRTAESAALTTLAAWVLQRGTRLCAGRCR